MQNRKADNMKEIKQEFLTGERALFQGHDLRITDTIFDDGESPLKESRNIELYGSMFKWKYPLWYSENITVKNCTWFEMARAGVWYTGNMTVTDLTLYGNYSFDGAKNVEIHNSRLLSKDAFWNSENVTVYDSFISGEYLGWNAKNLTLINCTVESLQGMCYIENLVMKNCHLINTTLAFEYSTVDAQIIGKIDSVLNPSGGNITADEIGILTVDKDKVDPSKTRIICPKINTSAK